jgi:pimeloyl-ACP methyl ester carboxylesterase
MSSAAPSGKPRAARFVAARPSGRGLTGTIVVPASAESRLAALAAGSAPAGRGAPPLPTVILLHGLLSHADHNFAPALAETLASALGLASVRFDFRGAASDAREPDFRYRFCGMDDDVDDTNVVADALEARGARIVAVIGHSRGAADVLLWGARRLAGGGAGGGVASAATTASSSTATALPDPFPIISIAPR